MKRLTAGLEAAGYIVLLLFLVAAGVYGAHISMTSPSACRAAGTKGVPGIAYLCAQRHEDGEVIIKDTPPAALKIQERLMR